MSHLYRLLGKNIAQFRREAKLTQEKLAEKTDYSVDFIGLVERGINAPTLARLKDIADVLGVEVWQLLFPGNVNQRNGRQFGAKKSAAKPQLRGAR